MINTIIQCFPFVKSKENKILARLNLSPLASGREIKKRFRELAKKYHPDTGGDAAQFIELMDIYRALLDKK